MKSEIALRMVESRFRALYDALLEFDEDGVLAAVDELLKSKLPPIEIANAAREALVEIGQMFERKEIFLTELMITGELLKTVMAKLGFSPEAMAKTQNMAKGTILMATVQGDIHDIGKNIVAGLLASHGYRVVDLGVDVAPAKIAEGVRSEKPAIVGLSGLLTAAYASMKAAVDALRSAGLRTGVKIMIGGGSTDAKVCEFVGADRFGASAVDAVTFAQKWIGK